jgi:hypothetical protein
VQLGANNCTVIVGFNAQLLKYFAVRHSLSVWHDGQNILAQLVSYLGREILVFLPPTHSPLMGVFSHSNLPRTIDIMSKLVYNNNTT